TDDAEGFLDRKVGIAAVALDTGQAFELNGRFHLVVDQHGGDRVMGTVVNGENELRHHWNWRARGGWCSLSRSWLAATSAGPQPPTWPGDGVDRGRSLTHPREPHRPAPRRRAIRRSSRSTAAADWPGAAA